MRAGGVCKAPKAQATVSSTKKPAHCRSAVLICLPRIALVSDRVKLIELQGFHDSKYITIRSLGSRKLLQIFAKKLYLVRHQHPLDRMHDLNNGGFLAHRSRMENEDETEIRNTGGSTEQVVKDIRRATRKQYSAEEKIRIVLDGLRGEYSIAELCRREGIAESLYYSWSKEFLEAGKRRLAGDTERSASTGEVKELRREVRDMKELVADLALENRVLKKSMIADGGDPE